MKYEHRSKNIVLNLKHGHVQLFCGLVFRNTGKGGPHDAVASQNYCHVSTLFCHENYGLDYSATTYV